MYFFTSSDFEIRIEESPVFEEKSEVEHKVYFGEKYVVMLCGAIRIKLQFFFSGPPRNEKFFVQAVSWWFRVLFGPRSGPSDFVLGGGMDSY